jgi:hypothetical protein
LKGKTNQDMNNKMQQKSREEKTREAHAKTGTTLNTRIHKTKGKTMQGGIRLGETKQNKTRQNIRQDETNENMDKYVLRTTYYVLRRQKKAKRLDRLVPIRRELFRSPIRCQDSDSSPILPTRPKKGRKDSKQDSNKTRPDNTKQDDTKTRTDMTPQDDTTQGNTTHDTRHKATQSNTTHDTRRKATQDKTTQDKITTRQHNHNTRQPQHKTTTTQDSYKTTTRQVNHNTS